MPVAPAPTELPKLGAFEPRQCLDMLGSGHRVTNTITTMPRDLAAARARGIERAQGTVALDDKFGAAVVATTQPGTGRPSGDG